MKNNAKKVMNIMKNNIRSVRVNLSFKPIIGITSAISKKYQKKNCSIELNAKA
jgi:hypothetical protein